MDASARSPHLVVLPRLAEERPAESLAHPTRLPGLVELEEVERHRSVHCDLYDGCLDRALRERWSGWTCAECPLFALADVFRSMQTDREGALRPTA